MLKLLWLGPRWCCTGPLAQTLAGRVGVARFPDLLPEKTRNLFQPLAGVTGGVNPRIDGEACAGEDKGAVEAPWIV